MSPLWEINKPIKIYRKGKDAKLPSPNLRIRSQGFAQSPILSFFETKPKQTQIFFIKGISRFISGSMTVEAALVLPLFLFFVLNLGSAMEMMRLHGRMETALWSIGREICTYGAALTFLDEDSRNKKTVAGEIGDLILSHTFIRKAVIHYLGEDYLDSAPLSGGKGGLCFLGSDLLNSEDCVEIVVTYGAVPQWSLKGFRPFLMENHYYGRLWTGYPILVDEDKYYLAENASVYHCTADCTYLRLSVSMIKREELAAAANSRGKQYRKCKTCIKTIVPGELWVAFQGECYHSRRDCPGLKRTVREVEKEEALKYRACHRCVGKLTKGELIRRIAERRKVA